MQLKYSTFEKVKSFLEMKNMYKVILLGLFTITVNFGHAASNGGLNKPSPKNNDSIVGSRSNIVIFKMITTPAPANTNNGSLKKAGKVARTSTSHSLSYSPPVHFVKPYS
ncbi:MAG: hypothetical protein ACXVPU_04455 [Bacteroidia bacterium]